VLHANGGETTLELFDDYLLGGYGGEGFALQGEAVFAATASSTPRPRSTTTPASTPRAASSSCSTAGRPTAPSCVARRLAQQAHDGQGARRGRPHRADRRRGRDSAQLLEMMEDRLRNPTLSMPARGARGRLADDRACGPRPRRTSPARPASTLAAARAGQAGPGRPLPGLTVELNAQVEAVRTHADNILGLIPGSDPSCATRS
jgi:hypothetical protein